MEIDHIGYLCKNIERSIEEFEKLGFEKISDLFMDEQYFEQTKSRNVKICFLRRDGYIIELVSPIPDKDSIIDKQITRQGEGPYHICYRVASLEKEIIEMQKSGYIVVQPPAPAIAMDGRRVAFLFKTGVGLLEFVETVL